MNPLSPGGARGLRRDDCISTFDDVIMIKIHEGFDTSPRTRYRTYVSRHSFHPTLTPTVRPARIHPLSQDWEQLSFTIPYLVRRIAYAYHRTPALLGLVKGGCHVAIHPSRSVNSCQYTVPTGTSSNHGSLLAVKHAVRDALTGS